MEHRGVPVKWLFMGLGTLLAAGVIIGGAAAVHRRRLKQNSDDIDGGVVKRYWADAPKTIESTEITQFHCVISLIASCETGCLGHRVYELNASAKNGDIVVQYSWRDRQTGNGKAEYKSDADFMARLHQIVTAYDFPQYNGYYHSVSGLPDMYGETLDILYASGEQINAHDNQSVFLPFEAEKELIMLFGAAPKIENQ